METIIDKDHLDQNILHKTPNPIEWKFGIHHKSHYMLSENNELIGCTNFISMFNSDFFQIILIDSIEIEKSQRGKGLGTHLILHCMNEYKIKYHSPLFYGIIVNSDSGRMKFASSVGFQLIDQWINSKGIHALITTPLIKQSKDYCKNIMTLFKWKGEHVDRIYSDCVHAKYPNNQGLYWCNHKKFYVSGLEREYCIFYKKASHCSRIENKIQKIKHIEVGKCS